MSEVIRPRHFLEIENERLKRELEESNRLLKLSASVSLGLIDEILKKQKEPTNHE